MQQDDFILKGFLFSIFPFNVFMINCAETLLKTFFCIASLMLIKEAE